MNNPLVSVITPCFNDGKYLLECIKSVNNSNYKNIEHIIIDDGSTDKNTCRILDTLDTSYIHLIRTKNQGVCKARNQAIKESTGKYLLPLDGDDIISDKYISLAVKELEDDNSISLVSTDYKLFGKKNKTINLEPYSLERLLGHNLFTNTSMYRREDFDKSRGYNLNMKDGLEDWDFWINILKNGGKVKYINGINFFYRIKNKNLSRNAKISNIETFALLRQQIWRNHQEIFSNNFLNPLETTEYLQIINSKEYKLGKILLKPIRKILNRN